MLPADRSIYGNQAAPAEPQRNKSHSLLSLSRGAPWHSLLAPPPTGHAATCQGMPGSCSSHPQRHGSCTWPGNPWLLPGNGERAGCCLTRRKASQNSRSERMQEFRRHLTSLPPSSTGFGCAGRSSQPQAPQQTLCRAPPDATILVETDFMGATFLFLLSSSRKKNQLPNQSSEKEETSAKELLSSPGLRHTKQLTGHTKQGPCKIQPCSQEMPKLKECPCSSGMAVLPTEGTSLHREVFWEHRTAPSVPRSPPPSPASQGWSHGQAEAGHLKPAEHGDQRKREFIQLFLWGGQAEFPSAGEKVPD